MSEETCLHSFVFISINAYKCAFLHGKKRQEKWHCTTLLPVAWLLKCYSGREEQPSSHGFYTNWNEGFHLGSPFSESNTLHETSLYLRYHRSCSFFFRRRKINFIFLDYHTIFNEFIFCWVMSVSLFLWINCYILFLYYAFHWCSIVKHIYLIAFFLYLNNSVSKW